MTEPLRNAPASEESAEADRDALIEKLLLAGLDHYFEGQYEQAVNVWTRVAFLERGHSRARAYIDRARGALAEQQRQIDELVHQGLDAYRSGDLGAARDLLTRAAADGGSETALVFLQRLGVAEAGLAAALPLPRATHDGSAAIRPPHGGRADTAPAARPTNWIATIVVSAAIAGAILLSAQPIASWLGDQPATDSGGNTDPAESVSVVRTADLRLARARELFQAGRLHDALRQLDAIDRGDALREDADALQSLIQTVLLAHTVPTSQGEATR